jgi:hypothetical protein
MLDWLKRALVDSYVGAVGLGYLLSQCVLHFVNIFAMPVVQWVARDQYHAIVPRLGSSGFSPKDALPDLVKFVVMLLVWLVLLRWLYFAAPQGQVSQQAPKPEKT